MSTATEGLAECLAECRDRPDWFNEVILQRPPYWSRQTEIALSVVKYRTTVAYTGNMVGKSYLAAGLIIWYLMTRPDSLVFVSGPSQTNLGTVIFTEVRRALEGAALPFGGKLSKGIKASPHLMEIAPGWRAIGLATTSVERASGQHNSNLLAVIEEASGVEDFVFEAIDSLGFDRLLMIGNPLKSQGRFIDAILQAAKDKADGLSPGRATNAIQVPSTESPHAHLEKSPCGLASASWIESIYRKHGKRSLYVGSHIDARIPDVDAEQLIPPKWLDWHRGEKRPAVRPRHPIEATRCIACDLAEGVGRDSTCVVVRDDWGVLEVELGSTMGLPEAAECISRMARKWRVEHNRISYDKLGVGRSFPNHLTRYGITTAIPYAGEGSPQDRTSFPNLRTECGWKLRNRLDATHLDYETNGRGFPQAPFCFPPGEYYGRLVDELRPLTYSLVGKMTKLLPKDDWAIALGHSPDVADALIQSMVHSKIGLVPRLKPPEPTRQELAMIETAVQIEGWS